MSEFLTVVHFHCQPDKISNLQGNGPLWSCLGGVSRLGEPRREHHFNSGWHHVVGPGPRLNKQEKRSPVSTDLSALPAEDVRCPQLGPPLPYVVSVLNSVMGSGKVTTINVLLFGPYSNCLGR